MNRLAAALLGVVVITMPFLGMWYSPAVPFKPNFAAISSLDERRVVFIRFMSKKVAYANQEVAATRTQLLSVLVEWQTTGALSRADRHWLHATAYVYQMPNFDIQRPADIHELLMRVDEVPASLVLAQAANESAWGTSRFAVMADNFFGQHCQIEGCGIVPLAGDSGHYFEVQRFKNVQDAINNYLYNLNTNDSYADFRTLRYHMRQQGQALDGHLLARQLGSYSELGDEYVLRIRSIIKNFGLKQYDAVDKDPQP
jgi:Bax protein